MPKGVSGVVSHRRHKKILKRSKGFVGSRGKTFRKARETLDRAGVYAYRDRRRKKRDFRKLWITRLSAAVKEEGFSYGRFIHGLKLANIKLDRKVLSDLAIHDREAFKQLVAVSKEKAA